MAESSAKEASASTMQSPSRSPPAEPALSFQKTRRLIDELERRMIRGELPADGAAQALARACTSMEELLGVPSAMPEPSASAATSWLGGIGAHVRIGESF